MPQSLYKLAEQAAKDDHYGKFSDYVQTLIEADVARRDSSIQLHDEKPPVTYPRRKRGISKEKEG